jgi:hypothetical protein
MISAGSTSGRFTNRRWEFAVSLKSCELIESDSVASSTSCSPSDWAGHAAAVCSTLRSMSRVRHDPEMLSAT